MSEKKSNAMKWVAIVILVLLSLVILFIIFWKREEHTSNDERIISVKLLECSGSGIEDAFFVSDTVQRYTHEIRATFKEEKLDDISYIYNGTYNSPEAVESSASRLHADYNIYMGKNNENPESLNPMFSNLKSKLKITLYSNKTGINPVTATLFFLDPDNLDSIRNYNINNLGGMYKEKGFVCEVK